MTTVDLPSSPDSAVPAPTTPGETTPRRAALIAGIGYVALFALAIFANFLVREGLIVEGNAAQTAVNIAASEPLFRAGLVGFMAIFVIDIAVAWALYVLFRTVNRDLSLLAAWSRLVYTVLLGVAVLFLFQALQLLDGRGLLESFTTEQLNAQALVALDTFNSAWLVGLLAFGIHLVLLGTLVVRSASAPKALGYLLALAGLAYMADTVAHTLLSTYADYAKLLTAIVAVPSVIAEGWFGLWLLIKGGKPPASA